MSSSSCDPFGISMSSNFCEKFFLPLKKIMSILQNILLHVCIAEMTFFLTLMHIKKHKSFLNNHMMFASFHSNGTTPSFNDKLNTLASGILILSTVSISSFGGIPSTPGDLLSLSS